MVKFFHLLIFLSGFIGPQAPGQYKLIVFEGSDWCTNCIRLEKTVLADSLFMEFIDKYNITLERIDFPQKIRLDEKTIQHNEKTAENYNFNGEFPTIILVNQEKKIIVKINFKNQNSSDFIKIIKSLIKPIT